MFRLNRCLIKFFDYIDKNFHQKKILKSLKKIRFNLNTFIDIGAHKGAYTDLIIANFSFKKIHIFEPQIKYYKFCIKKYKKNKNIKCYDYGLSNKNCKKNLNVDEHEASTTLLKFNKKNFFLKLKSYIFQKKSKNKLNKKYKVNLFTLKNFLLKKRILKVNLIKIDTEGHELNILNGLKDKIKDIQVIIIEFHHSNRFVGYNQKKIHAHLIKNNFFCYKSFKFPFLAFEDRIYLNKNDNLL